MNDRQEPHDKCNILIVFGDGRWGATFHQHFCEKHSRDFDQIVGVVDSKYQRQAKTITDEADAEAPPPPLARIFEEGSACKIEYMDFSRLSGNDEDLNRLIQEYRINWLCLAPFGETFHTPQSVQFVLENFKKNRGKNVLMISSAGCESEKVPITDLIHCENEVRVQFPTKSCILRTQVLLEDLDYFARDVKKEKTWKLPTGDGSFVPVCLKEDVTLAAAIIMRPKDIEKRFGDKTFNLTGNALVNGITLASLTESAFNQRHFKFSNITFAEARDVIEKQRGEKKKKEPECERERETTNKRKGNVILEWMGHAKKLIVGSRPSSDAETTPRRSRNRGCYDAREDDALRREEGLGWLSVIERDIILNRFELVREGLMAFRTEDVQGITGHEPIAVTAYLRTHEDSFKGED